VNSRFYFDKNFQEEQVDEMYQLWVEKAVLGTFDHECFCFFHLGKPIAFTTLRYSSSEQAAFQLMGISESVRARGVSHRLVSQMCSHLLDKGVTTLSTVTQGRNYAALRCFQQAGFKTSNTSLWYHKWF
jgi:dTDP-4-amino-4,6-dideoxy-D-galactose acyltransferase